MFLKYHMVRHHPTLEEKGDVPQASFRLWIVSWFNEDEECYNETRLYIF